MGGWVSNVVDTVRDAVSDVGGFVKDATSDIVNTSSNAIKDITQFSLDTSGISYVDDKLLGGFIQNVSMGVVDNANMFAQGVIAGDWTQVRDGGLGLVTTVVAVIAIVVGAFLTIFGIPIGPWMMAAGFIVLDAQYNEGKVLGKVINIAADVETAVFNTHYIEEYAVEIQMLITVAATMYAGYVAGPFIANFTGISAVAQQWSFELNMIQAGYGGYQTYMAVQLILDSQAYWKAKLAEYEAEIKQWMSQAQAARNQWFDMMTNPDLINRIQAGGDLFNMGAGHDMFSITSVAEPRFALGLIDKSDPEMDRMINNRYFAQLAGNDGFKPI